MDLLPDQLGQLQHRRGLRRRDVEILVLCGRVQHCRADAFGHISAVCVAADLVSATQYVHGILIFDDLLHEVGHDMAHGEIDVAAGYFFAMEGAVFAHADTVEWSADRIGQPVLLPGTAREELAREFLKAVGARRRGTLALVTFGCRKNRRVLVDHAAAEHGDFLQCALRERRNGGVEARRNDPLVLGEQIVRVFVKVGDPADPGRAGNEVFAPQGQIGEQVGVLGISLYETVSGVTLIALLDQAVLGIVVHADDLVPEVKQFLHEIACDETGRSGDKNGHRCVVRPAGRTCTWGSAAGSGDSGAGRQRQTSITIFPAGGESWR